MLHDRPDKPPFPEAVDSTMLSTAKGCGEKFRLSFLENLASPKPSVHLSFGSAYAKGLEVSRHAVYGDGIPVDEAIVQGICAAFAEFPFGPFEEEDKNTAALWSAIESYWTTYPPGKDIITPYRKADGTPALEFRFALPLPHTTHPVTGNPILYCGRLDMFGHFQKGLWFVDDKTTTRLGKQWIESWSLRSQFLGYAWAAKQLGFPIVGGIVRGCAIRKYNIEFVDVPVYAPQFQLDRWLRQTVMDINLLLHQWETDSFSFNLGDTCTAYSGCPFRRLCESPNPEVWAAQFDRRAWNPLADNPHESAVPKSETNQESFS